LSRGLISREAARNLEDSYQRAIKDLVPHTNDCIEAFGIPDIKNLHCPISRNYIQFNSQRDMNNFDAAGPLFDFQKGATRKSQYMARL
jgi:hypothetical protein